MMDFVFCEICHRWVKNKNYDEEKSKCKYCLEKYNDPIE